MKNCNDTIGYRTRDLPACSSVPQPTAPPAVPQLYILAKNMTEIQRKDSSTVLQADWVYKQCNEMSVLNSGSVILYGILSLNYVKYLYPQFTDILVHDTYTKTINFSIYEGWNFNFGNTPLDWIQ